MTPETKPPRLVGTLIELIATMTPEEIECVRAAMKARAEADARAGSRAAAAEIDALVVQWEWVLAALREANPVRGTEYETDRARTDAIGSLMRAIAGARARAGELRARGREPEPPAPVQE